MGQGCCSGGEGKGEQAPGHAQGESSGPPGGGPGGGGPGEAKEGCCGGEKSRGDRHAEETLRMWDEAFWQAFKELHVEAVKAKLKDAWGPRIEAMAGEIVAAHQKEWEAFRKERDAKKLADDARAEAQQVYDALLEKVEDASKDGPQ